MNLRSARRLGFERGSDLGKTCQDYVLKKFKNRYTKDHKPTWANEPLLGRERKPQFASDEEWLAHTWFKVNSWGFIDPHHDGFYSRPTWPDGKE